MELEQLKTIWKQATVDESEGYFISHAEVRELIKNRSNSAVSKIKRGVRNKVFMAGGIGTTMLLLSGVMLVVDDLEFPLIGAVSGINAFIFYLVFGLVICSISVFNAYTFKKIKDIETFESDLKTSISNILSVLRSAINAKIYSDTCVVPLTVLVTAIVHAIQGDLVATNTPFFLIISGAICFAIFSYFLTKYGQKKRYGNQIRELEECLKELEEQR